MRKLKSVLENELGTGKRFYPELLKALDDGWRWYKPWTWEFFRSSGKPKVMEIKTRFRAVSGSKPGKYSGPHEKQIVDDLGESEEDYRNRLLNKTRCASHFEYAEKSLISADAQNRDPADFIPLGLSVRISESECIKLAGRNPFSLDDIKSLFWDKRP